MGKTNKTFSVNDEYIAIFEERRAELGMTVTAYFEHLIDTEHKKAQAATPVEVIKDNPVHLTRIAELEAELEAEKENHKKLKKDFEKLDLSEGILKQEVEILQGRKFAANNETILQLDPINVKILTYVAMREGNKRKQEWTISDVVNWFVHHRFEKGTLNGGFDSVPDKIINQMRKELE